MDNSPEYLAREEKSIADARLDEIEAKSLKEIDGCEE